MSNDFAIIKTGGKQYRVSAGDKLVVEKLPGTASKSGAPAATKAVGDTIIFDAVLLRSTGGKVEIGAPHVAGAKVEAKFLGNFKDRTKIVFKYHSKARYKKKKGHRQPHTEVQIVKI
jgi:large subunit ribosomal protein L21